MSKIGLLFDMDGVIVDNHIFHYQAWKQFFEKYNIPLTEDAYKHTINGRTLINIIREYFGEGMTEEDARRYGNEKEQCYRDIYGKNLKPVKGLLSFLDAAKEAGIDMVIGTSAPLENVEFTIDGIGIRDYFSGIIFDKHVTKGKPDPEVYQKCAEVIGLSNEQCIVFEDAILGIQAGKASGSKVIGLSTTHKAHELTETDININDFTEITVDQCIELVNQ